MTMNAFDKIDPHNIVRIILDRLHNDLKRNPKAILPDENGYDGCKFYQLDCYWEENHKNEKSVIADLFYG